MQRGDYLELPKTLVANFVVMQLMCSFCYLGDNITTLAAGTYRSICDAEWYNYPPTIQRLFIPIMMRSQKPFVMTGYSLVSASLVSLKEVREMRKFLWNSYSKIHKYFNYIQSIDLQMMSFVASAFLLLQKMNG